MEENNIRDGEPVRENPRKKRKIIRILFIVVLILLFLTSVTLIAGSLYLDYILSFVNQVDGTREPISNTDMEAFKESDREVWDPDFDGQVLNPEDVVVETVGQMPEEGEEVVNILLIGHDGRSIQTGSRSDAMILCSYHRTRGELTMVSFLRDMYVTIPDYCDYKLNAAYAWGDMDLLNRTLSVNFGIEIHGNFAVGFQSFQSVIDLLGGVDVELTAAEARYLGSYRYSQGINTLSGKDALSYTRLRSIGDGDFDRTNRQRKVMQAILEKCKTLSLSELNELLEQVLPMVDTNMNPEQIKAYALEILPMLATTDSKTSVRIPLEGTYQYAWISGMSVLMTDMTQNREYLKKTLYGS